MRTRNKSSEQCPHRARQRCRRRRVIVAVASQRKTRYKIRHIRMHGVEYNTSEVISYCIYFAIKSVHFIYVRALLFAISSFPPLINARAMKSVPIYNVRA